uniref:Fibronectin type-III domain-containing protein n=1 Tax=Mola mola TaxID=94237 RepID=A0A3Q3VT65_MOLML
MRIFLPLLCALCAPPIHGVFYGTCHRKDPSPGTLVLSPGQELVLTCSGRVIVDGVKIRNISHGYSNHTNLTVAREPRGLGGTDTGYTAPPTAHIQPTTGEDDSTEEDEEEQKEGSRVTRDIKLRPYWNWMGRTVGKADRGVTGRTGATLSLSSLSLADSGTYTCQRGRERFSLKVIVTDPVEKPILFCYKKSPSSKIRCESVPQGPVTIKPNCHLLIGKSQTEAFLPSRCSYSSQASRCWCTLDHNEDELRTVHVAYLCVTSVAGNATSNLLTFTPMSILKPDPPSNVSVRQEEGQEKRLKVTWSLPTSWKSHDYYYDLIYELKYRPLSSTQKIKDKRSYLINDVMPGFEYLIQLRTKEEYDGLWSEWSTAVYASSWTGKYIHNSIKEKKPDLCLSTHHPLIIEI